MTMWPEDIRDAYEQVPAGDILFTISSVQAGVQSVTRGNSAVELKTEQLHLTIEAPSSHKGVTFDHTIFIGSDDDPMAHNVETLKRGGASKFKSFAAKAGIDLKVLSEIVPFSAGASRAFDFFPRLVFPRDFPGQGSLNIVAKDLHLACELARDVGSLSRIGDIADDVFKRAQAQGLGHLGFGAAVQVLEQMEEQ